MLAVHAGIPPHLLADLPPLVIVDHYQYVMESQEAASDGR